MLWFCALIFIVVELEKADKDRGHIPYFQYLRQYRPGLLAALVVVLCFCAIVIIGGLAY